MLASLIHDNTPKSISKQGGNILGLLQGISEFVGERMEQGQYRETILVDFLANVSLSSGPGYGRQQRWRLSH